MAIGDDLRRGLRPAHGARLLLDRERATAERAHYAAWILTADGELGYAAELGADGSVTLAARGQPADAEAEEDLRMLARLTARGAAKRAADGLAPWPPRVLRWRGAGRGG
jgi:hypothetical protein